jgi:hypothetical protein
VTIKSGVYRRISSPSLESIEKEIVSAGSKKEEEADSVALSAAPAISINLLRNLSLVAQRLQAPFPTAQQSLSPALALPTFLEKFFATLSKILPTLYLPPPDEVLSTTLVDLLSHSSAPILPLPPVVDAVRRLKPRSDEDRSLLLQLTALVLRVVLRNVEARAR